MRTYVISIFFEKKNLNSRGVRFTKILWKKKVAIVTSACN